MVKNFLWFYLFMSFISYRSMAMDLPNLPPEDKVHFCLTDEEKCYNLPLWKVKESETLHDAYLLDRKEYPKQKCKINLSGISRKELELFDRALDTDINPLSTSSFSLFFQGLNDEERRLLTIVAGEFGPNGGKKLNAHRLSAQLFDEQIDYKGDIALAFIKPRFSEALSHYKFGAIKENLDNQRVNILPPYVYVSNELFNAVPRVVDIKRLPGGGYLYFPCVAKLSQKNFNGKSIQSAITHKGSRYPLYARTDIGPEIGYMISGAAIDKDGNIKSNEINIFKFHDSEKELIKNIEHESKIYAAYLSPNGKWLVTASVPYRGRTNTLQLTCLDPLDDSPMFSDINLAHPNGFVDFCFNHTSTILACAEANVRVQGFNIDPIKVPMIKFFDIQTKNIIKTLDLATSNINLSAVNIALSFNNDSSRFVCFVQNKDTAITFIWDTSDINNVIELARHIEEEHISCSAAIDFNYPTQDTLVISTSYMTFFNVKTGKFLSKTTKPSIDRCAGGLAESSTEFVATASMPYYPVTFVGKNHAKSSSVSLYHNLTGEEIGVITYAQTGLESIGVTNDGANLIVTFDNHQAVKAELCKRILPMVKEMRFVDLYILLQLYYAKQLNIQDPLHHSLVNYIKEIFPSAEDSKEIIKKYF